MPHNAVKGQVLANFLSKAPEGEKDELYFLMPEVPMEKDDTESWTLYTDRASSSKGSGAGLVLIRPSGIEYTYALRLTFPSTNNEAEYEALLAGLRIAKQMNISNIEVKVDSKLVASQINGNYEASKDSMIKYLAKAREYASIFKSFLIENIPRNMNQKADVLSKLASVAFNHLTKEVLVEVLNERSTESPSAETAKNSHDVHYGPVAVLSVGHGHLRTAPTGKGRFGLPWIIVTDNGTQLVNDSFKSWCERFEIHQMNTTLAHPQANGLIERANKSLMEGINTHLGREKVGWVDELPNILWAHRNSIKQSNRKTPFSLTYGSEAVIPAEIGIPTYRTLMIREGYNEEVIRLNLDLLQERRETTAVREARYKTKMEQYYNKKVRPTGFRP
ncbi:reverse transcriptase domain-containing protein [Tanacetum coccineum]|uniref:Reverse transcriptase domain-containing protein n=1 Tax=Tanacetum coccineum TaxID=301880 RepID=A0ABQ4XRU3_9ASTR